MVNEKLETEGFEVRLGEGAGSLWEILHGELQEIVSCLLGFMRKKYDMPEEQSDDTLIEFALNEFREAAVSLRMKTCRIYSLGQAKVRR